MDRDWNSVLSEHVSAVGRLVAAGGAIDAIANALVATFREGRRVYILGNGGSAADAQHIAAELTGRFKRERRALPAVALTTDSSALSAIGNDLGFERVFARQIEALADAGDVVLILSTSGNSPNVLAAARAARERGARVIGFTGQSGGKLAPLCDLSFAAPHTGSDRIQEMHQLAYHYVCERVEAAFS
jgi:D-sedoheptulose 7-phosphate isomerase